MLEEVFFAEKLTDTYRLLRHDFMNHLQVISGYLQLGNLEKAQEYTYKATAVLHKHSSLAEIELAQLRAFLIWFILNQKGKALNMDVDSDGEHHPLMKYDKELTRIMMDILFPLDNIDDDDITCRIILKKNKVDIYLEGEIAILDKTEYIQGLAANWKYPSLVTKINSCQGLHISITVRE